MSKYLELLALTQVERETTLKSENDRAVAIKSEATELQKSATKTIVAMIKSDCLGSGDIAKEAKRITGLDIRSTFQSIYALIHVFTAIVDGKIEMTEEDYDKGESSKMAKLSPLLADDSTEEQKAKLPAIVEMIKAGKTVKEIDEAIGGEKKEPKAVKEQRERAEKAEKTLESVLEASKAAPEPIPYGFIATDIEKTDPLIRSTQALNRLKADFAAAADDTSDAGTTLLNEMMWVFGSMLASTAAALETDATDFVAEIVANMAKAAAGSDATVETPAALAIAV